MRSNLDDIDGSIVSIHVRNFFCHDNLEIHFNRNVNFIVGRNGSGKSAILTALVVGLGGRASVTNRAANLTSFIKKGAKIATIEIKIKNSSPRAYRHEVYGDFITIQRTLSVSSSPSYKIKSAAGDIISTKYEEVNAIVLAHDIQVDNPISVLNQDDARSFHATDAKKKFSLFCRATNLDQTENNYKESIRNCEKATAQLKKKLEAFQELESEQRKWKAYHEQLQSHHKIVELKRNLENEYYWSEIAEKEHEVNLIQAKRDNYKAEIDVLKQELREINMNDENRNTEIQNLKQQLEEKVNQKNQLDQRLRSLGKEANDARAKLREIENNHDKSVYLFNKENQKIKDLSQAIQHIGSGDVETQRAELEQRKADAERAASEARARYDTARHEAQQARHNHEDAGARLRDERTRAARLRASLEHLRQQLRELESSGSDPLAVYNRQMSDLYRLINSQPKGHFSAPPKGPIGAYLKVKEKRWGPALEHIIGGSIRSFCVNTSEDSRKLFELINRVYGSSMKPTVTCSPFLPRHDVSAGRVRGGRHSSALDALDVAEPVVANYLIDNLHMERILLVPTHDEAIRLCESEENVPQNCFKIVTLNGTEFFPAPNYRSYGADKRTSRFLLVSIAERKRQLIENIESNETEMRTLQAEIEKLNVDVQQASELEKVAARDLKALLTHLQDKTEQERTAAEALAQHQAPQYDALMDDLNASKKERDRLELQIKELTDKVEQFKLKRINIDDEMTAVENELRGHDLDCQKFREVIDKLEMKHEKGYSRKSLLETKVREIEVKLEQENKSLAAKRAVIDAKIQSTFKLHPRIENPRAFATVEQLLCQVKTKLDSMRFDGLTREQVIKKYLEVQQQYDEVKQTLWSLKNLIDLLNTTAQDHLRFCERVQTEIIRRVQHAFQVILKVRGYPGQLKISSANGEVEFEGRNSSSTASLSGGERTYCTVAFILALWECVQLPFYFMDEFDVFMDKVNRKAVMDLLISHALNNTNRQFAFLTPQDTSSITAEPRISIHVMEDPRP